ncbi:MAG: GumC family protein [Syntrophobacterales bacterium]|nr:GumC family protein [Syntrophobacterales bacterium]
MTDQSDQHQTLPFGGLRDFLTIVFKHKAKIIGIFSICFVIATAIAIQLPRTYEAKSILLVKLGREFSRPEVGASGQGLAISPETIMESEIQILTGKELISKVIDSVGLANIYPDLNKMPKNGMQQAQAIRMFEGSLAVTNPSKSTLLHVAFTHQNPYIAAKVVNTLVDNFKDKHLEVFKGDTTSFLKSQRDIFQEKLRESEDNLKRFKEKNRIFSFDEQKSSLIEQIGALDGSLKMAQSQINELEQKAAFIRSSRWNTDTHQEMRTHLLTLQQKERELLEKYTEDSKTVQIVRGEIQATKDGIKKNLEELRQLELTKIEGELGIIKVRANSLKGQLGQAHGELRVLDSLGRELQALKRDVSQHEQNYQTYVKKLEESLIMDDMDRQKIIAISVLEKAMPPVSPKTRKLKSGQMVAVGSFGGLAGGVALAILLEASVMTTPRNAERRLGLPVMVAITKK